MVEIRSFTIVAESLLLRIRDAVRVGGGVLAVVADEPHDVIVGVARPDGGVHGGGAILPGAAAQRRAGQHAAARQQQGARLAAEAAAGTAVGRVHEDREEHRRRHQVSCSVHAVDLT